jgi:hypothetical protein
MPYRSLLENDEHLVNASLGLHVSQVCVFGSSFALMSVAATPARANLYSVLCPTSALSILKSEVSILLAK